MTSRDDDPRFRTLRRAALVIATCAACLAPSARAAERGVQRAFMDTTCSPCRDFFRYANGRWYDAAVIPPEYPNIGANREIYDRNQAHVLAVLEQAAADAATTKDATLAKVGRLYTTMMDSARADRDGIEPIAADLRAIDAIASPADLGRAFARFEALGLNVPFRFEPEADPKQSTMTIGRIAQAGLGLPDRDYYFRKDPGSDSLRHAYVAHVARTLELSGVDRGKASADAQRVMEIENALAASSMTNVAQRDPHAVYHKMTVKELAKLAPGIDWIAWFREVSVPSLAREDGALDVSQPEFVTQLGRLVAERPIEDWRAYLRWHLVNAASPWLSSALFQESFAFNSRLSGAKAPLPRWKRAAVAIDGAMGEALGKAYVERYFPPSSKARVQEMVANLKGACRERIDVLPWMSAATRAQATKKLDAILEKIGYPEQWRDYGALEIDGAASGFANLSRARRFEAKRTRDQIGKPVDRTEWGMTPPTVNAYYNPLVNEIVFPAGILSAPQFDPEFDDAVNYGAIGMVIGHEITHGFDDEGRQYDAKGNLEDWWTKEDAARFQERAQRVIDQYNGYVAVDTLHVNGALTLGENIADLGGVTIAYHAWRRSLRGKPRPPDIDGFTPEQRFFLGMAQGWRRKLRPELTRLRTLTDPHSPGEWRVKGPLSNFPEFQKAFGCKAGDPMVKDESVRAEIW